MDRLKNYAIRLLLWLEKYTRTDMMYLAKGGFWTILAQIIVSSSTFLLAIAFAHYVSKETYGQYKYILSIASILGTFTLTGLGTAVLQSVTRGLDGTLKYAFWENIKWSAFAFLLTCGLAIYYFMHDNMALGIALLVVGSFSPFLASTNLYNSYLMAKKDFKRSAIYFNIIGNLFPAFCIFLTILLTDNPVVLVVVYFVSNTLIGLILYTRVVNIYKPNNEVDSQSLNYSKHLSFIGILGTIADNIDQILIFHYVGGAQLAIYNFAVAIPAQIKGPMKGLSGLIFPKFVERSDTEIRRGMGNKILVLFVTTLAIIVAYIFLAPYIFDLFFPKYSDSIIYSQIFSLSLFAIISIPADSYLVAKKKIKEQYIGSISGSLIQIAILAIGVIWGGLLGLVIAQTTTKVLWGFLSITLYEKASREAVRASA